MDLRAGHDVSEKTGKAPTRGGGPLRVGIVGGGLMGQWHAWAAKKTGGRVLAVADVNTEAAKDFAEGRRIPGCFSDFGEMIKNTELDVVHICTPPSTHYGLAETGIEAGINLLVDKPLAQTAGDTKSLLGKAAERGVLVCPAQQFLFQHGVLKAREMLPRIGRPIHMSGTICSAGGEGLYEVDTQSGASTTLDELTFDILPHLLSLMQAFLPDGLPRENWAAIRSDKGELSAFCETSGITLSVFISMNVRPTECSFKIGGADGTIHMDMFHGYSFMEPGAVSRVNKIARPFDLAVRRFSAAGVNIGRRTVSWEPAFPGLRRLVSSFYGAVREGTGAPIPPGDTIAVACVRDLLIRRTALGGTDGPCA